MGVLLIIMHPLTQSILILFHKQAFLKKVSQSSKNYFKFGSKKRATTEKKSNASVFGIQLLGRFLIGI